MIYKITALPILFITTNLLARYDTSNPNNYIVNRGKATVV